MKTKSKLVLGLSILASATLAAGATSTFAWWQIGDASKTLNEVSKNLTVSADSYTMDALVMTPSFAAVTETVGGQNLATFVSGEPGSFGHVHLSNANGATFAKDKDSSKLVDVTSQVQAYQWYGVGKVQVAITLGGNPVSLNQGANDKLAVYAGTYTVTVATPNNADPAATNYARVRPTAPSRGDGTAAAAAVSFTITITAAGDVYTSNRTGAGTNESPYVDAAELKFYYMESPKDTDGTAKDETSDHTYDLIAASIGYSA